MSYKFFTPRETRVGCGVFEETGAYAAKLGRRFAVISGASAMRKSGVLDALFKQLEASGVLYFPFEGIGEEPDCAIADCGAQFAKENKCDGVIGIGGGSPMDVAKCVAGLASNDGVLMDYLDGVGKGKKLKNPPIAHIAIPTTSGTGAETTFNAVLLSKTEGWKRSFRDERLMPDVAIVDPILSLTLQPRQTAESGLDALAHLIEATMTVAASPLSDMAAKAGIERARSLLLACKDGNNINAREDMAIASMLGGMAITNSGVTAAHALGSGVGGAMRIGHGIACGILLPHVMELNRSVAADRLDEVGRLLTGKLFALKGDGAKAAVDYIFELNDRIGIPRDFKHLDITPNDLDRIMAGKSQSSLAKNPVKLDEPGWREFLKKLI